MEKQSCEAPNVTAFDTLYTTNRLQKLKILLPCLEYPLQKYLAVYIKYSELQYTLTCGGSASLQSCAYPASAMSACAGMPDLSELCRQLRLYSTPEEIRQLEQLQSTLQTIQTYQEMQETLQSMQELFPDMNMDLSNPGGLSGGSPGGEMSLPDLLLGMLTPEQRSMYEAFMQPQEQTGERADF